MSDQPDPVATVLRQLLDQVQSIVPQSLRLQFEEDCARLGATFIERLRGDPIPVVLLWQGHLIEMFDLCARWMLSLPIESAAIVSAYEGAMVGVIAVFMNVGTTVGVDVEELRGGLAARHLYWRAEALKKHRCWVEEQDAVRLGQRARPAPGEVIAAFLARHQMSEKELLGRAGKFSKNTLAKIKKGEVGVRPDRYTALAVAMAEVEPNFERDSLLPG